MPVIAFANPKGGAGKTTSALLLAGELAGKGARVAIIDADPERWISQWARLPGKPASLEIIADVTEDTIVDHIEAAARTAQFVIVDLEGTASLMVANAIGMSDLVIIPTQGATMDAKGAAKTIKLIRNQERVSKRSIPHSILLTRTSAAVPSRSLRNVRQQLDKAGIDIFDTAIVERAAYRDILDFGGLLRDLSPDQVSNIERAKENARAFAGEVLAKLRRILEPRQVQPEPATAVGAASESGSVRPSGSSGSASDAAAVEQAASDLERAPVAQSVSRGGGGRASGMPAIADSVRTSFEDANGSADSEPHVESGSAGKVVA